LRPGLIEDRLEEALRDFAFQQPLAVLSEDRRVSHRLVQVSVGGGG